MIERKFVSEKIKEFQIQRFITKNLTKVGLSHIKLIRTPLGEKIVISTSHPGLVVGRKGENIKNLTQLLKTKFNLSNPQIEINEVENIHTDANIIAEKIASYLERFGSANFKGVGHKTMSEVMGAGALGIEILISGKIPGSRAKRWRFYQGYLKKCGDISITGVRSAYIPALLKTGIVGVQVRIMPPNIKLPDRIELKEEKEEIIEELPEKTEKDEATAATREGDTKEKKVEEGSENEKKPKKRGRRKKKQAEEKKETDNSKEKVEKEERREEEKKEIEKEQVKNEE
jgi:small subunit ribosomal protein S3